MLAIKNATLVMRDHLIPGAVLFIENGLIADFGEMRTTPIPEGCQIVDAEGLYVGPGLVDIHSHAGASVRFNDDPVTAAKGHLVAGTTSVLATLGYRHTTEEYVRFIKEIRELMKKPEGANIAGIYMEGPYINPNFGSLRHLNPWTGAIVPEDYVPFVEAAGTDARIWALGPEREGIEEFVQYVHNFNPAAKFTVAHSEASPQQIEKLMPYGLCIGTHHTNATGDRPMYPECRGVCVDEAVNYNSEIYAELISDSMGIHVDPYMQRLIRRIKGDERIILISDQTAHATPNPEGFEHVDDLNFTFTAEGGIDISGSKLTLNLACRNYMKHTGASIVDAFRVASYNPAKVAGLSDRGEIRKGLRADLVITDHRMNIKSVILKGEFTK